MMHLDLIGAPFAGVAPRRLLQDEQLGAERASERFVAVTQAHEASDARCEVWRIGLISPAAKHVREMQVVLRHVLIHDAVGLIAIAYDIQTSLLAHGVVDDERRVTDLGRISGLGIESTFVVVAEYSVLAVGAPAHNPVYLDDELARVVNAHDDASSGVRIGGEACKIFDGLFLVGIHVCAFLKL